MLGRWLVGADGSTDLSEGEWQKIALARLYFRDAKLLALDEPTSNLDAEAEADFYHHLKRIAQDRTCLLISHRLSTVRTASLVASLVDGRTDEIGTHKALIELGGAYSRFFEMQADRYA
jgi:ATP-binding cassette subfamily B protein